MVRLQVWGGREDGGGSNGGGSGTLTEPIYGPVHSGGVGLGSGSGAGLGLILGAGGGGEACEGGEDRPPRPGNWKKMSNSQKNHWKRQGGKARKGEKVRL